MKKELEIKAKFDTSDFDKSVELMQKKLKDLYAPADAVRMQTQTSQRMQAAGMGGIMSSPGADAYSKATQQGRRELEQSIRSEARMQEQLGKEIVKRVESLRKLKDQQKELVKGSQEELAVKEKIARVEENNSRQREQYKQRDAAINQMLTARETLRPQGIDRLMQAYRGGGIGGAMTAGGRMASGNPLGVIGGIGTVAGAIGGIGAAAEQFTGYGLRLEQARGSAIQNTTGLDLQRIYGGKSAFEAAYLPERGEAAGLAAQKAERNRWTDRMKGIGSVGGLIGGAAGMIGGGALMATGVGIPLGATMMGAGAAAFGGGIAGLSNDRSRQGIFGGQEYEQLLRSQQAKDFRETLESLKNQDPAKRLALEGFETNYQRDVGAQRTLGMSGAQFRGQGGFLQRGANAGFMNDQMIGMGQNIIAAGGSARMGQQAQFGLQMERMGQTNASGILGSLSGSIQNVESTKRATIAIMSEAFKIGLDNTDFAEENRKFTQAAAGVIGRSGATTESDQDRISKALSMFMGERTNAGVAAGQDAYERYQQRGSQLGGRRGALRFSGAMQDKNLRNIKSDELTELLGMRPEDLQENNEAIQYFSQQAGLKPQELIKKVTDLTSGINAPANFMIPGKQAKAKGFADTINAYMQKEGIGQQELTERQKAGQLPADISAAYGGLEVTRNIESKSGLTPKDVRADVGEFLTGAATGRGGKAEVETQLGNKGGRLEDVFISSGAAAADKARDAFNALVPTLEKMGEAAKQLADPIGAASTALSNAANAQRGTRPQGDAANRDISNSNLPPAMRQPQAGKGRQ